ncbi:MAG: polyprenyl synthetase family protein, partial [FCB group bacterium]
VCEGQALDMEFNSRQDINLQDYLNMIEKKTAWLLKTAAIIGGHIGLGNEKEISALDNFALNLGMGFQIQDDLLDLTAEEAKLGKTVGQDILEGKKTFLIISAMAKVKNKDDKELLNKFYKDNGLPLEYVPLIKDVMYRLDVIDETEKIIENYFKQARNYINLLPENIYSEMLVSMLKSLDKRNY